MADDKPAMGGYVTGGVYRIGDDCAFPVDTRGFGLGWPVKRGKGRRGIRPAVRWMWSFELTGAEKDKLRGLIAELAERRLARG